MDNTPPPSPSIRVISPTPPPSDFIPPSPIGATTPNVLNVEKISTEISASPSPSPSSEPEDRVTIGTVTTADCEVGVVTVETVGGSNMGHSMPDPPIIAHLEEPAEARARLPRCRRILISVCTYNSENHSLSTFDLSV